MDIALHISDYWCGVASGVMGLLAFEILLTWLLSRKRKDKSDSSNP